MNRTELKQMVEDCGCDRERIKERLEQYFETDEGKAVLTRPPGAWSIPVRLRGTRRTACRVKR